MAVDRVIEAFNSAASAADIKRAERMARRLPPLDQLQVVDSIRAADARGGHAPGLAAKLRAFEAAAAGADDQDDGVF